MVNRCTLYAPLLMVIPPGGTTIPCPIHPEGHFIRGQKVDNFSQTFGYYEAIRRP